MDVRIGVTHTPKELEIELDDDADPATVKADLEAAIADGRIAWLTDRRGRQVGVPAEKIAWIEVGSPDTDRRIGFGS